MVRTTVGLIGSNRVEQREQARCFHAPAWLVFVEKVTTQQQRVSFHAHSVLQNFLKSGEGVVLTHGVLLPDAQVVVGRNKQAHGAAVVRRHRADPFFKSPGE